MPRRIYTYLAPTGWGTLNLVATIGAYTIARRVLVFIINAVASWRGGESPATNPWDSSGLEWATTSPPPQLQLRASARRARAGIRCGRRRSSCRCVTGLRTDRREVLVTTTFDALPDSRHVAPDPSVWPLYLALCMGVVFIGSIFSPYYRARRDWAWPAIGMLGWGIQSTKTIEPEIVELPGGAITERA